jgi:NifU-like protein involved in Fe-S cluster formation
MASDIVQEWFLDHYLRPRNFGPPAGPHLCGTAENLRCGDRITVDVVLDRSSGRIEVARFEGTGCLYSVVSASVLTEWLIGRTVEEARRLDERGLLSILDVPLSPIRANCALLLLDALQQALAAGTRLTP